jgi:hypothetical protein
MWFMDVGTFHHHTIYGRSSVYDGYFDLDRVMTTNTPIVILCFYLVTRKCTLEKGIAVSKPEQEVELAFCFRPRQPLQAIVLRHSFSSRLFGEVLWGGITTCTI